MASLTEGAKARQEARAMELKFHQDKLKQLTAESKNGATYIGTNIESVHVENTVEKAGHSNGSGGNAADVTLIFGYASVIWKPGFPYVNKWWGYVKGYKRRFWQGSPDHRGTPRYPGRVATLLPMNTIDNLEKKMQDASQGNDVKGQIKPAEQEDGTWGVVYEIDPKKAKDILAKLDHREKAGFIRVVLPVHCEDGETRMALVYAAGEFNESFLGPTHTATMAWHIYNSVGPSGPNKEYLYELYNVMIVEKKLRDFHIETLYNTCKSFDDLKPCTAVNDFEQNQDFCAKYFGFGRPIKVVNVEWPHIFYYYINEEIVRNGGNSEVDGMDKIVHANALYHLRQKTHAFVFQKLAEDDSDGGKDDDNGVGNIGGDDSSDSSSDDE